MKKIKEALKMDLDNFNHRFMNNGINGVLPDKFQDADKLLIRDFYMQSQQKLLEAVLEELEDENRCKYNEAEHCSCLPAFNHEFKEFINSLK